MKKSIFTKITAILIIQLFLWSNICYADSNGTIAGNSSITHYKYVLEQARKFLALNGGQSPKGVRPPNFPINPQISALRSPMFSNPEFQKKHAEKAGRKLLSFTDMIIAMVSISAVYILRTGKGLACISEWLKTVSQRTGKNISLFDNGNSTMLVTADDEQLRVTATGITAINAADRNNDSKPTGKSKKPLSAKETLIQHGFSEEEADTVIGELDYLEDRITKHNDRSRVILAELRNKTHPFNFTNLISYSALYRMFYFGGVFILIQSFLLSFVFKNNPLFMLLLPNVFLGVGAFLSILFFIANGFADSKNHTIFVKTYKESKKGCFENKIVHESSHVLFPKSEHAVIYAIGFLRMHEVARCEFTEQFMKGSKKGLKIARTAQELADKAGDQQTAWDFLCLMAKGIDYDEAYTQCGGQLLAPEEKLQTVASVSEPRRMSLNGILPLFTGINGLKKLSGAGDISPVLPGYIKILIFTAAGIVFIWSVIRPVYKVTIERAADKALADLVQGHADRRNLGILGWRGIWRELKKELANRKSVVNSKFSSYNVTALLNRYNISAGALTLNQKKALVSYRERYGAVELGKYISLTGEDGIDFISDIDIWIIHQSLAGLKGKRIKDKVYYGALISSLNKTRHRLKDAIGKMLYFEKDPDLAQGVERASMDSLGYILYGYAIGEFNDSHWTGCLARAQEEYEILSDIMTAITEGNFILNSSADKESLSQADKLYFISLNREVNGKNGTFPVVLSYKKANGYFRIHSYALGISLRLDYEPNTKTEKLRYVIDFDMDANNEMNERISEQGHSRFSNLTYHRNGYLMRFVPWRWNRVMRRLRRRTVLDNIKSEEPGTAGAENIMAMVSLGLKTNTGDKVSLWQAGVRPFLEEIALGTILLLPQFIAWALTTFGFPEASQVFKAVAYAISAVITLLIYGPMNNLFASLHKRKYKSIDGVIKDSGATSPEDRAKLSEKSRRIHIPVLISAFTGGFAAVPVLVMAGALALVIILHYEHNFVTAPDTGEDMLMAANGGTEDTPVFEKAAMLKKEAALVAAEIMKFNELHFDILISDGYIKATRNVGPIGFGPIITFSDSKEHCDVYNVSERMKGNEDISIDTPYEINDIKINIDAFKKFFLMLGRNRVVVGDYMKTMDFDEGKTPDDISEVTASILDGLHITKEHIALQILADNAEIFKDSVPEKIPAECIEAIEIIAAKSAIKGIAYNAAKVFEGIFTAKEQEHLLEWVKAHRPKFTENLSKIFEAQTRLTGIHRMLHDVDKEVAAVRGIVNNHLLSKYELPDDILERIKVFYKEFLTNIPAMYRPLREEQNLIKKMQLTDEFIKEFIPKIESLEEDIKGFIQEVEKRNISSIDSERYLHQDLEYLLHLASMARMIVQERLKLVDTSRINVNSILKYDALFKSLEFPDIEINGDFTENIPDVLGYAAEIEEAVFNLIDNAVYALKGTDNPRIDVISEYDEQNGEVLIKVRDNGSGMSREVKEKASEVAYTTKPEGEGTGFGLANVADMAREQGGSINIESEEGVGTEITIRLRAIEEGSRVKGQGSRKSNTTSLPKTGAFLPDGQGQALNASFLGLGLGMGNIFGGLGQMFTGNGAFTAETVQAGAVFNGWDILSVSIILCAVVYVLFRAAAKNRKFLQYAIPAVLMTGLFLLPGVLGAQELLSNLPDTLSAADDISTASQTGLSPAWAKALVIIEGVLLTAIITIIFLLVHYRRRAAAPEKHSRKSLKVSDKSADKKKSLPVFGKNKGAVQQEYPVISDIYYADKFEERFDEILYFSKLFGYTDAIDRWERLVAQLKQELHQKGVIEDFIETIQKHDYSLKEDQAIELVPDFIKLLKKKGIKDEKRILQIYDAAIYAMQHGLSAGYIYVYRASFWRLLLKILEKEDFTDEGIKQQKLLLDLGDLLYLIGTGDGLTVENLIKDYKKVLAEKNNGFNDIVDITRKRYQEEVFFKSTKMYSGYSAKESAVKINKRQRTITENMDGRIKDWQAYFKYSSSGLEYKQTYGLTLSEVFYGLPLCNRDSYLIDNFIDKLRKLDESAKKEEPSGLRNIGIFQAVLCIFIRVNQYYPVNPRAAKYLFRDLLQAETEADYVDWLDQKLVPILRSKLIEKKVSLPSIADNWKNAGSADVIIAAMAGFNAGTSGISPDYDERAKRIKLFLGQQTEVQKGIYEYLIALTYSSLLAYLPDSQVSLLSRGLAQKHKFKTYSIWFALFKINVWNNAFAGKESKGKLDRAGYNLLGLASELGHIVAEHIAEKNNLLVNEEKLEGDKKYYFGAMHEFFDRLMWLSEKDSMFLEDHRINEYIYLKIKAGREWMDWVVKQDFDYDDRTFLKKVFNDFGFDSDETSINRWLQHPDMEFFLQSELLQLIDIAKSNRGKDIFKEYPQCIEKFTDDVFNTPSYIKAEQLKAQIIKEKGAAEFENQFEQVAGVHFLSAEGKPDVMLRQKRKDPLLKGLEKHKFAEYLSEEFMLQLITASYEAGIGPSVQPYLMPKAIEYFVKWGFAVLPDKHKQIMDTIRGIDKDLVKQWVTELQEDGLLAPRLKKTEKTEVMFSGESAKNDIGTITVTDLIDDDVKESIGYEDEQYAGTHMYGFVLIPFLNLQQMFTGNGALQEAGGQVIQAGFDVGSVLISAAILILVAWKILSDRKAMEKTSGSYNLLKNISGVDSALKERALGLLLEIPSRAGGKNKLKYFSEFLKEKTATTNFYLNKLEDIANDSIEGYSSEEELAFIDLLDKTASEYRLLLYMFNVINNDVIGHRKTKIELASKLQALQENIKRRVKEVASGLFFAAKLQDFCEKVFLPKIESLGFRVIGDNIYTTEGKIKKGYVDGKDYISVKIKPVSKNEQDEKREIFLRNLIKRGLISILIAAILLPLVFLLIDKAPRWFGFVDNGVFTAGGARLPDGQALQTAGGQGQFMQAGFDFGSGIILAVILYAVIVLSRELHEKYLTKKADELFRTVRQNGGIDARAAVLIEEIIDDSTDEELSRFKEILNEKTANIQVNVSILNKGTGYSEFIDYYQLEKIKTSLNNAVDEYLLIYALFASVYQGAKDRFEEMNLFARQIEGLKINMEIKVINAINSGELNAEVAEFCRQEVLPTLENAAFLISDKDIKFVGISSTVSMGADSEPEVSLIISEHDRGSAVVKRIKLVNKIFQATLLGIIILSGTYILKMLIWPVVKALYKILQTKLSDISEGAIEAGMFGGASVWMFAVAAAMFAAAPALRRVIKGENTSDKDELNLAELIAQQPLSAKLQFFANKDKKIKEISGEEKEAFKQELISEACRMTDSSISRKEAEYELELLAREAVVAAESVKVFSEETERPVFTIGLAKVGTPYTWAAQDPLDQLTDDERELFLKEVLLQKQELKKLKDEAVREDIAILMTAQRWMEPGEDGSEPRLKWFTHTINYFISSNKDFAEIQIKKFQKEYKYLFKKAKVNMAFIDSSCSDRDPVSFTNIITKLGWYYEGRNYKFIFNEFRYEDEYEPVCDSVKALKAQNKKGFKKRIMCLFVNPAKDNWDGKDRPFKARAWQDDLLPTGKILFDRPPGVEHIKYKDVFRTLVQEKVSQLRQSGWKTDIEIDRSKRDASKDDETAGTSEQGNGLSRVSALTFLGFIRYSPDEGILNNIFGVEKLFGIANADAFVISILALIAIGAVLFAGKQEDENNFLRFSDEGFKAVTAGQKEQFKKTLRKAACDMTEEDISLDEVDYELELMAKESIMAAESAKAFSEDTGCPVFAIGQARVGIPYTWAAQDPLDQLTDDGRKMFLKDVSLQEQKLKNIKNDIVRNDTAVLITAQRWMKPGDDDGEPKLKWFTHTVCHYISSDRNIAEFQLKRFKKEYNYLFRKAKINIVFIDSSYSDRDPLSFRNIINDLIGANTGPRYGFIFEYFRNKRGKFIDEPVKALKAKDKKGFKKRIMCLFVNPAKVDWDGKDRPFKRRAWQDDFLDTGKAVFESNTGEGRNKYKGAFKAFIKEKIVQLRQSGWNSGIERPEQILLKDVIKKIKRNEKVQVCFTCFANENRSALTHILAADRAQKSGLTNIKIVSAGMVDGTASSKKLKSKYVALLNSLGISADKIEEFSSEKFDAADAASDIIITISERQKEEIIKLYPETEGKIILYTDIDANLPNYKGVFTDPNYLDDKELKKFVNSVQVLLIDKLFPASKKAVSKAPMVLLPWFIRVNKDGVVSKKSAGWSPTKEELIFGGLLAIFALPWVLAVFGTLGSWGVSTDVIQFLRSDTYKAIYTVIFGTTNAVFGVLHKRKYIKDKDGDIVDAGETSEGEKSFLGFAGAMFRAAFLLGILCNTPWAVMAGMAISTGLHYLYNYVIAPKFNLQLATINGAVEPKLPSHWREEWPVPTDEEKKIAEEFYKELLETRNKMVGERDGDTTRLRISEAFMYVHEKIISKARILRTLYYMKPEIAAALIAGIQYHTSWESALALREEGARDIEPAVMASIYDDAMAGRYKSYMEKLIPQYFTEDFPEEFIAYLPLKYGLAILDKLKGAAYHNAMVGINRTCNKDAPEFVYETAEKLLRYAGIMSEKNNETPHVAEAVPVLLGKAIGKLVVCADPQKSYEQLKGLADVKEPVIFVSEYLTGNYPLPQLKGLISFAQEGETSHARKQERYSRIVRALVPGKEYFGEGIIDSLEGEYVVYEVTKDGVSIRRASEEEIQSLPDDPAQLEIEHVVLPEVELDEGELYLEPGNAQLKNNKAAGYKASELHKMKEQSVKTGYPDVEIEFPEDAALPYRSFEYCLERSGRKTEYLEKVRKIQAMSDSRDRALLEERLEELRNMILAPGFIPEKLKEEFRQKGGLELLKKGAYVRGAHNAQDLPDYPDFGAGTYFTVANIKTEAGFWEAVSEVWASTWSEEAFIERKMSHVEQETVHPAVWIVSSVPADYSFTISSKHKMADGTESFLVEFVQGQGDSLNDPEFTGIPTQIFINRDTGKIEKVNICTKTEKTVLAEEGGTKIKSVIPDKEISFIDNYDALAKSLWQMAMNEEKRTGTKRDIEGAVKYNVENGRWTVFPLQTRSLKVDIEDASVSAGTVDHGYNGGKISAQQAKAAVETAQAENETLRSLGESIKKSLGFEQGLKAEDLVALSQGGFEGLGHQRRNEINWDIAEDIIDLLYGDALVDEPEFADEQILTGTRIAAVNPSSPMDVRIDWHKLPDGSLELVDVKIDAGGDSIHVADIAAKLGKKVALIALSGKHNGKINKVWKSKFANKNIYAEFTEAGNDDIKVNIYHVIDEKESIRLASRGENISELTITQFLENIDQTLKKSKGAIKYLAVTANKGILFADTPGLCRSIVDISHKNNVEAVIDFSLSSKDDEINAVLTDIDRKEPADIIVPNDSELITILKATGLKSNAELKDIEDDEAVVKYARLIVDKFNLKGALITRGDKGLVWVDRDNAIIRENIPVDVKDTVGCGDAAKTGFIMALADGKSVEEAVTEANIFGAATAATYRRVPDISMIEKLRNEKTGGITEHGQRTEKQVFSALAPHISAEIIDWVYSRFGQEWDLAFDMMGEHLLNKERWGLIDRAQKAGLNICAIAGLLHHTSLGGKMIFEDFPFQFQEIVIDGYERGRGNRKSISRGENIDNLFIAYTMAYKDWNAETVYEKDNSAFLRELIQNSDSDLRGQIKSILENRKYNLDKKTIALLLEIQSRDGQFQRWSANKIYQNSGLASLYGTTGEEHIDFDAQQSWGAMNANQISVSIVESDIKGKRLTIWLTDKDIIETLIKIEPEIRYDLRDNALLLSTVSFEANDAGSIKIKQLQAYLRSRKEVLRELLGSIEEITLDVFISYANQQGYKNIYFAGTERLFDHTAYPLDRHVINRLANLFRNKSFNFVYEEDGGLWKYDRNIQQEGQVLQTAGACLPDGQGQALLIAGGQAKAAVETAQAEGRQISEDELEKILSKGFDAERAHSPESKNIFHEMFGPNTPLPNVYVLSHAKFKELGLVDKVKDEEGRFVEVSKGAVRYMGENGSNNIVIDAEYLADMQNSTAAEYKPIINILVHEQMAHWCEKNSVPAIDTPMMIEARIDLADWQKRHAAHSRKVVVTAKSSATLGLHVRQCIAVQETYKDIKKVLPDIEIVFEQENGSLSKQLNESVSLKNSAFLYYKNTIQITVSGPYTEDVLRKAALIFRKMVGEPRFNAGFAPADDVNGANIKLAQQLRKEIADDIAEIAQQLQQEKERGIDGAVDRAMRGSATISITEKIWGIDEFVNLVPLITIYKESGTLTTAPVAEQLKEALTKIYSGLDTKNPDALVSWIAEIVDEIEKDFVSGMAENMRYKKLIAMNQRILDKYNDTGKRLWMRNIQTPEGKEGLIRVIENMYVPFIEALKSPGGINSNEMVMGLEKMRKKQISDALTDIVIFARAYNESIRRTTQRGNLDKLRDLLANRRDEVVEEMEKIARKGNPEPFDEKLANEVLDEYQRAIEELRGGSHTASIGMLSRMGKTTAAQAIAKLLKGEVYYTENPFDDLYIKSPEDFPGSGFILLVNDAERLMDEQKIKLKEKYADKKILYINYDLSYELQTRGARERLIIDSNSEGAYFCISIHATEFNHLRKGHRDYEKFVAALNFITREINPEKAKIKLKGIFSDKWPEFGAWLWANGEEELALAFGFTRSPVTADMGGYDTGHRTQDTEDPEIRGSGEPGEIPKDKKLLVTGNQLPETTASAVKPEEAQEKEQAGSIDILNEKKKNAIGKTVPCGVCGSAEFSSLYTVKDKGGNEFQMVKCSRCGVIYNPVPPSAEELEAIYNTGYFTGESPIGAGYSNYLSEDTMEMRLSRADIGAQLLTLYHTEPGELLEIGCGAGLFLATMKKYKWNVEGIEFAEEMAQEGRKRFDLKITTGDFGEMDIKRKYDAIALLDVMEHFQHPLEVLKKINGLLRDENSVLMIRTPNFDSEARKEQEADWSEFKLEHLYTFSPASLEKALNLAGLEIVGIFNDAEMLNKVNANTNKELMTLWNRHYKERGAVSDFQMNVIIRKASKPNDKHDTGYRTQDTRKPGIPAQKPAGRRKSAEPGEIPNDKKLLVASNQLPETTAPAVEQDAVQVDEVTTYLDGKSNAITKEDVEQIIADEPFDSHTKRFLWFFREETLENNGIRFEDVLKGRMLNIGLESVEDTFGKSMWLVPSNIVSNLRLLGVDIVGLDPLADNDPDNGYYEGGVENMPFADDSFENIISIGLFDKGYIKFGTNIDSYEDFCKKAINEIKRVLVDGGAVFIDLYREQSELVEIFKEAGFTAIDLGYHYVFVNHKSDKSEMVVDFQGNSDLRRFFPDSSNPVRIEVGFGSGKGLVETAIANPDKNYLGIEPGNKFSEIFKYLPDGVKLDNLRVVPAADWDIFEAQKQENFVDEIYYIMFNRESETELHSDEGIARIFNLLKEGGRLFISTDAFPVSIEERLINAGFTNVTKKMPFPISQQFPHASENYGHAEYEFYVFEKPDIQQVVSENIQLSEGQMQALRSGFETLLLSWEDINEGGLKVTCTKDRIDFMPYDDGEATKGYGVVDAFINAADLKTLLNKHGISGLNIEEAPEGLYQIMISVIDFLNQQAPGKLDSDEFKKSYNMEMKFDQGVMTVQTGA